MPCTTTALAALSWSDGYASTAHPCLLSAWPHHALLSCPADYDYSVVQATAARYHAFLSQGRNSLSLSLQHDGDAALALAAAFSERQEELGWPASQSKPQQRQAQLSVAPGFGGAMAHHHHHQRPPSPDDLDQLPVKGPAATPTGRGLMHTKAAVGGLPFQQVSGLQPRVTQPAQGSLLDRFQAGSRQVPSSAGQLHTETLRPHSAASGTTNHSEWASSGSRANSTPEAHSTSSNSSVDEEGMVMGRGRPGLLMQQPAPGTQGTAASLQHLKSRRLDSATKRLQQQQQQPYLSIATPGQAARSRTPLPATATATSASFDKFSLRRSRSQTPQPTAAARPAAPAPSPYAVTPLQQGGGLALAAPPNWDNMRTPTVQLSAEGAARLARKAAPAPSVAAAAYAGQPVPARQQHGSAGQRHATPTQAQQQQQQLAASSGGGRAVRTLSAGPVMGGAAPQGMQYHSNTQVPMDSHPHHRQAERLYHQHSQHSWPINGELQQLTQQQLVQQQAQEAALAGLLGDFYDEDERSAMLPPDEQRVLLLPPGYSAGPAAVQQQQAMWNGQGGQYHAQQAMWTGGPAWSEQQPVQQQQQQQPQQQWQGEGVHGSLGYRGMYATFQGAVPQQRQQHQQRPAAATHSVLQQQQQQQAHGGPWGRPSAAPSLYQNPAAHQPGHLMQDDDDGEEEAGLTGGSEDEALFCDMLKQGALREQQMLKAVLQSWRQTATAGVRRQRRLEQVCTV